MLTQVLSTSVFAAPCDTLIRMAVVVPDPLIVIVMIYLSTEDGYAKRWSVKLRSAAVVIRPK